MNGRDLAGTVVKVFDESQSESSRIRVGDTVLVPSTDYRDIRKAAFQEYAVATEYNAARIPANVSVHVSASLGVAFVASILALGVSLGLDFSRIQGLPGPNFVDILQHIGENDSSIPEDIRGECFKVRKERERLKSGDYVAIWGGTLSISFASGRPPTLIPFFFFFLSVNNDWLPYPATSQTCRPQGYMYCRSRPIRRTTSYYGCGRARGPA